MRASICSENPPTLLDPLKPLYHYIVVLSAIITIAGCSTTPEKTIDPVSTSQSNTQVDPEPTLPRPSVDSGTKKGVRNAIEEPVVSKSVMQSKDLWQRLREGFALPVLDTKRVAFYERLFTAQPEYIERIFTRASWFLPSILEAVEAKGFPTEIALLPAVESAFKPDAKSHSGASGLWQFIVSTGHLYGMRENWWYDARRDPELSTAAAIQFLGELNERFNGDWLLSFAGYNAGGGNIQKAIRRNQREKRPVHFTALKLPKETTDYVPKLVAFRNIVKNPAKFNIKLPPIPTSPAIAGFDVGSQIDLSIFASSLGVDQKVMQFLNRAYKHGVTPPNGPHRIQLPIGKLAIAKQKLKAFGEQNPTQWVHHRVQAGDVLGRISNKYKVSISAIKQANQLSSNIIQLGQILLIPTIKSNAFAKIAAMSPSNPSSNTKKKVTHLVRKGDTLWKIAKHYGVKVSQISLWNKISASQILRLGQKLLIYT